MTAVSGVGRSAASFSTLKQEVRARHDRTAEGTGVAVTIDCENGNPWSTV